MFKKTMFFFLVALLSLTVNAGWESGEVQKILIHDNGQGQEKIDIKLTGVDEGGMEWCHSSKEWVIHLSNVKEKGDRFILKKKGTDLF